jgi:SAM-dependent methyltransferase
MDLRSFKLHRVDRHVRVVLGDHRGQHPRDLHGDAFERVHAAAAPLLAELATQAGAELRALSVDGVAGVVRLTTATEPPRPLVLRGPEHAALAELLAPLARALLAELRTRSPDLPGATPSQAAFWEQLYRDDVEAGWELGRAAPPLVEYFEAQPPTGLRVLVLGCGRGHEARLLAGLGAAVTALDLAPAAIAAAIAATPAGLAIDYRVGDLFELSRAPACFDLVAEHCCFCAIEPARRDEYVEQVAAALVPGGALVGLFYSHGRPGGPPFTVDADELRARFGRRFTVDSLAPAVGSVLGRQGQELLARFTRD